MQVVGCGLRDLAWQLAADSRKIVVGTERGFWYGVEAMHSRKQGHTLIEMLVVLIIVGVLIALVVPAVQKIRESARLAQNIKNQRELVLAVQMFVTNEGHYPGYKFMLGGNEAGWVGQILPYIGRSDIYETNLASTPYIEILVSPVDDGPRDQPRLSYVVNGGLPDQFDPETDGGLPAGTTAADGVDGIFYDHTMSTTPRVSNDDIIDGLKHTMLLSENIDARYWTDVTEPYQCILWQSVAEPLAAGKGINMGVGTSGGSHTVARPSSHHPNGVVAGFADGTSRFIVETIDPAVYRDMLTPRGKDVGLQ
jgi:prepilin-type N-terminal cleavage/methylation domain-containing protein